MLIDPDDASAGKLTEIMHGIGMQVVRMTSAAAALEELHYLEPAVVVLDYGLEDLPPAQVVGQLRAAARQMRILALVGNADVARAAEAVRAGIRNVLDKSAAPERLGPLLSAMMAEPGGSKDPAPAAPHDPERARFLQTYAGVFRRSARMRELEPTVLRVAESNESVLIRGERGVGKKLIARALHYLSGRSAAPWARVGCSALPPDQLEAEIFGYEETPGKAETARGGTLVLDGVSELPLALQGKLVQLLQDGTIYRAGGRDAIPVDVRLVATTSKSLEALVGSGAVRDDLYYLLNVMTVVVPPLRERGDEIVALAETFRTRFMEQHRSDVVPFSPELAELLATYHWPGNVLELENVIKRYVVLGEETQIAAELRARARLARSARRLGVQAGRGEGGASLHEIGRTAAREAETAAILDILDQVQWNRAEAARVLKVSYKTLLSKLNQAGIAGRRRSAPPL